MRLLIALTIIAALSAAFPVWGLPPTVWPEKGGVPFEGNYGLLDISTPTISLNDLASETVTLADYLPSGTQGFEFHVAGDVILGHADTIATSGASTGYIGHKIASGTVFQWSGICGTFVGELTADNGNATVTLDICW